MSNILSPEFSLYGGHAGHSTASNSTHTEDTLPGGNNSSPSTMEMIGTLAVLIIAVFIGGAIPKLTKKCSGKKFDCILSLFNAGVAGFFLVLPLGEIIPDILKELSKRVIGLDDDAFEAKQEERKRSNNFSEAQLKEFEEQREETGEKLEESFRWVGEMIFTGYLFVLGFEHVVTRFGLFVCSLRTKRMIDEKSNFIDDVENENKATIIDCASTNNNAGTALTPSEKITIKDVDSSIPQRTDSVQRTGDQAISLEGSHNLASLDRGDTLQEDDENCFKNCCKKNSSKNNSNITNSTNSTKHRKNESALMTAELASEDYPQQNSVLKKIMNSTISKKQKKEQETYAANRLLNSHIDLSAVVVPGPNHSVNMSAADENTSSPTLLVEGCAIEKPESSMVEKSMVETDATDVGATKKRSTGNSLIVNSAAVVTGSLNHDQKRPHPSYCTVQTKNSSNPNYLNVDSANENARDSHSRRFGSAKSPKGSIRRRFSSRLSAKSAFSNNSKSSASSTDSDDSLTKESPGTALFLLIALSIHAIGEGFFLGDKLFIHRDLKVFLSSLAFFGLDKCIEGLALGVSLMKAPFYANRAACFWGMICVQAFSSPLGLIIAYGLQQSYKCDDAAAACDPEAKKRFEESQEQFENVTLALNAITAGMLLYVSATEVIPELFEDEPDKKTYKAKGDSGAEKVKKFKNAFTAGLKFSIFTAVGYMALYLLF